MIWEIGELNKLQAWSVIAIFGVTLVSLSYSPIFPFVLPQLFVRGDCGTKTGVGSSKQSLWCDLGQAGSPY